MTESILQPDAAVHTDILDRIDAAVERNPNWPLCADYEDLTADGQRQARLATLRRQNTPLDFVGAWMLFRHCYLICTEPGFFYHRYVESPPFHYELIEFAADYARNLVAAPRGYAKSVIVGTELPLMLMLTRPYIRVALGMATDKLIEDRFEVFNRQLTENSYIRDDFGLQKPKRGMAIWNRHHIQLLNGSKLQGFSVTGRKRGARPDMFILDDPEYDPDTEGGALVARERFEVFLFKQVIPMLESGSGIYWIGTLIGRRSFIGHACYGDDARFTYWNRRIYSAVSDDPQNGDASLLWEGKWDKQTLDVRCAEIGKANFQSEYLNRPGSNQDRTLRIDPILNEYTAVDGRAEALSVSSPRLIRYHDKTTSAAETPANDLFNRMYRVIAFDPARGLSSHHDYSAITVLGFDRSNTLWVLDMWMGRAAESTLMRHIFRLGLRWRVNVIGIESVSRQIALVDSIGTYLTEHGDEAFEANWKPRIVPIDYANRRGGSSKSERISTLEWRFDTGRIKYPAHLKDKWPISALYAQTQDFTYDMNLLEFDDALDTVAMGHFIVHARGASGGPASLTPPETFEQKLARGQTHICGMPIIQAFGGALITESILDRITGDYANRLAPAGAYGDNPAYPSTRRRNLRYQPKHAARHNGGRRKTLLIKEIRQ